MFSVDKSISQQQLNNFSNLFNNRMIIVKTIAHFVNMQYIKHVNDLQEWIISTRVDKE